MIDRIIGRGGWVAVAIVGFAMAGPAFADPVAPIYTKNAALRLPVQLDARGRAAGAEVKLFVRGPSGRWEVAQTGPATKGVFDFRAPTDGEYWFTFVTVDKKGTATPPNVAAVPPHRVVVVDTTPPEVSAQPIPLRGERFLQCHVRDDNPDWSSLRVAYLAPDNTWQPLTVTAADTPTVFRVPNAAVFESKIRVTAGDRAGNRTTREIDLGDPTAPLGLPGKPTVDKGKPDPTLFPKEEPVGAVARPPVSIPDIVKAPKIDPAELPAIPDVSGVIVPDLTELKIPDLAPVKAPGIIAPRVGDLPPVPAVLPSPDVVVPDLTPPPVGVSSMKPSESTDPILAPPDPRPLPEKMVEQAAAPAHPLLNTRTCSINYQWEGVVRAAARIDFWATPDGGKSWVALRDEAGGMSPAKLTLPGDGVFGIRIRPGAGKKPPEPGEDPDCIVEIDATAPTVTLMQPTLGGGSDEGTMLIAWTASDKHLLTNSINLSYATQPAGPWVVIVSGYKNDGLYRWTMPTALVGNVYLRLEASDRAGNIGRHDLGTPVVLEAPSKQRVKVMSVGPAK